MDNCIFCRIVTGEMPADKVYENDQAVAFLDINPVHPGHLLLIPKEHYPMMVDTPDELVGNLFILAKKLMPAMKQGLGCDFVMLSVVGTDVAHFHIQLIPRQFNDGLHGWPTHPYEPGKADITAAKIMKAVEDLKL